VLALLLAAAGARAQSRPAPSKDAAVILILDASKSMKDDDGTGRPKFQAAKEALDTLVDELPDEAKVGLRVYGSEVSGTGRRAGCADTKLVSPVAALDRAGIKAQIGALEPRGFTPIGAPSRTSGRRSRRPSCWCPTAATTASRRIRARSRARSPRAAST
jgi:Ca-activated chloride channel family protein